MAQMLKDNVRERIVESAKIEFYEKGYEKASMRSIAKRADMTVGNIYRYFENKEAVHSFIVSSTQDEINKAIESLSANTISFDTSVYNVKVNVNNLTDMLDGFAARLVKIYSVNKEEFMILFSADASKQQIENWFSKVIKYIILTCYPLKKFEKQVSIISASFAKSIFAGLLDFFRNDYEDLHSLTNMIKIYLRTYVHMFELDVRVLLNSLN